MLWLREPGVYCCRNDCCARTDTQAEFAAMNKNSMTCEEFVDSLAGFRDDELTPPDYIRAQEHLISCEKCSAYLRGYERTIQLAKKTRSKSSNSAVSTALPENLVHNIMHAWRRS